MGERGKGAWRKYTFPEDPELQTAPGFSEESMISWLVGKYRVTKLCLHPKHANVKLHSMRSVHPVITVQVDKTQDLLLIHLLFSNKQFFSALTSFWIDYIILSPVQLPDGDT